MATMRDFSARTRRIAILDFPYRAPARSRGNTTGPQVASFIFPGHPDIERLRCETYTGPGIQAVASKDGQRWRAQPAAPTTLQGPSSAMVAGDLSAPLAPVVATATDPAAASATSVGML